MAKMQNTYVTHAVSLCVYSILERSALLPIIRYINYRFTPPFTKINSCNNISVNEQANIAGVHQLFIVPVCALFMVRAILFAEGGWVS